MITEKIKALFQFIEYLNSNIENFNQYNNLINELNLLNDNRQKLKPQKNYRDKLKHNDIQAELESKNKTLQDNTAGLIKAKAKELNVCNFEKDTVYGWLGIENEIHQLKENFSNKDLPEIFKHKNLYLEYRANTHRTYLSLDFFFKELDEILKELFDFFKDTEHNEFEAFEAKTIQVDNVQEIAEIMSGTTKLNLTIDSTLSITEKLDYWKGIIDNLINIPVNEKSEKEKLTPSQIDNEIDKLRLKYFGSNYSLISPLSIPNELYQTHFKNALNTPEFTYWFLIHNAEIYYEFVKQKLNEKLNSPIAKTFIEKELKELNTFEKKAKKLLIDGKFDIYNHPYHTYTFEVEYLRIEAGYYKTYALPSVQSIGNPTVVLYANHIYLKRFLEKQLSESLPTKQSEKPKLGLRDFFSSKVSDKTIESVQTEFKELQGKDLAILIYLLHKEYRIIEILTNSKKQGRKSFVRCLTENENPSMQKVDKCFVPNTDEITYSQEDLIFQSLNKRLSKVIENLAV